MRLKTTTWILVAALAATALYYFLVEERSRTDKELERRANSKLFFYEMKDIASFTLINPQKERIDVERDGETWTLVSPVAAPGDVPAITSFLGQVVPGRRVAAIAEPRDAADYGLADPFATLIVRRRDAERPDTLFVGDTTPTSSNSYVRIGAAGPMLISSDITHNVMNKSVFHLRDKEFLAIHAETIDSLAVTAGARTLRLRKDGGSWWFAGRRVRANRAVIEPYLGSLAQAIIHRFVREDTDELAPYGLAAPPTKLTIRRGAETTNIFFGSRREDKVHVVRDGLDKVVLLEEKLLAPFEWTEKNIRAMNLSFTAEDAVRAARYETPDTSVVFRRAGARKWAVADGDTTSLRSWEISALLRKLASTRFDRILAEPFSPSDERIAAPGITIILENGAGAVIDRIVIAPASDGTEPGASLSANCVGALPIGTAEAIHAIFLRIGGST